jgi:hypothetical protein
VKDKSIGMLSGHSTVGQWVLRFCCCATPDNATGVAEVPAIQAMPKIDPALEVRQDAADPVGGVEMVV